MPYILTDEPAGGQGKEAFKALDDAFGTSEFSQGQALTVIANALDAESGTDAAVVFNALVGGRYVTEIE